jgi:hypothetical protein
MALANTDTPNVYQRSYDDYENKLLPALLSFSNTFLVIQRCP